MNPPAARVVAAAIFAGAALVGASPARAQFVADDGEAARREERRQPYALPTVEPRRSESLAGAGTVEIGVSNTIVDVAARESALAGALSGRLSLLGFSGALTYRVHVSGALGGGAAGLLTRFAGDASVGPAVALARGAHLFARVGMEAASHTDDALQSSVYTVPSGYAGFQLAGDGFTFELGPRGGLTLRSTYDPGNEAEGMRLHRRSRVRPSWGGTAAAVSERLLFEASLTRVEERTGVWFADGALCGIVGSGSRDAGFLFCAAGQYWRALASAPDGVSREVPAYSIGGSVGIAFTQLRAP